MEDDCQPGVGKEAGCVGEEGSFRVEGVHAVAEEDQIELLFVVVVVERHRGAADISPVPQAGERWLVVVTGGEPRLETGGEEVVGLVGDVSPDFVSLRGGEAAEHRDRAGADF